MKDLFSLLPIELQSLIYEFDPTYRACYREVLTSIQWPQHRKVYRFKHIPGFFSVQQPDWFRFRDADLVAFSSTQASRQMSITHFLLKMEQVN
jgi:hypothetical protein